VSVRSSPQERPKRIISYTKHDSRSVAPKPTLMSAFMPSKSRPTVSLLKYLHPSAHRSFTSELASPNTPAHFQAAGFRSRAANGTSCRPLRQVPSRYPLVLLHFQTRVLCDRDVIAPCRGGEVDCLRAGVEAREEGGTDAEGAGAGDGLGDGELQRISGAWAQGCQTKGATVSSAAASRAKMSEGAETMLPRCSRK
jgi:hypothetical protein